MFKRIVVANDGSVGGFKALALACDIAKRAGTALHMISVEVLPNMPASIDEVIEAKTDENHKFHDVLAKASASRIEISEDARAIHSADVTDRILPFQAHDPEKWKPVSRLREARFGGRRKVGQDHAQTKDSRSHQPLRAVSGDSIPIATKGSGGGGHGQPDTGLKAVRHPRRMPCLNPTTRHSHCP